MSFSRTTLARQANEMALEVRERARLDFRSPLNIYDLCERLEVKVQFVDITSMEGVIVRRGRPTIMLSALRPAPRKVFTCAHELGHLVFGHRAPIDQVGDRTSVGWSDPNEFLVDTFSGLLLMPQRAVTRAFVMRGWNYATAGPNEYYTVACSFSVGYDTLVTHVFRGLRLVDSGRAAALERASVPAIRKSVLGCGTKDPLVVVDRSYLLPTVDAEVGTLLLFPPGAQVESRSGVLEVVGGLAGGSLLKAARPGLIRVHVPGEDWAVIARVCRFQYVGLSHFRHLEDEGDDDAIAVEASVPGAPEESDGAR